MASLLVDNDSDDRAMYPEYFQAQGFEVCEVGTTDETVTLTSVVDVIVTGLLVAGTIDAIDVITRVRSTRINIPIIVVTACANNDRIAKAEQVGADAVLLKPCLPDTLLHEVQHAIDAKV